MSGKSKTSRREEKKGSPLKNIIIAVVLGVAVYFIFIAVFAAFALKSGAGDSSYMPAGMAVGAVSALISGFAAVRPIKEKGAVYGALTGLVQALISSLVLFIVNHASAGNGIFILTAVMIICGMLGGIAAVNMKKRKKY